MDKKKDLYKILLLGDSYVGKSCILERYIDRTFKEVYLGSIGLDFKNKEMKMKDGKNIKLQIWDAAGNHRFRSITKNYYKGANCIVLIYDVTEERCLYNQKDWIEQIRDEVSDKIPIILVGNKIDKEKQRVVTKEQGKNFAEKYGLLFSECSAKTGENIDDIFNEIAGMMYDPDLKRKKIEKKIRREYKEKFIIENLNILMKYISC